MSDFDQTLKPHLKAYASQKNKYFWPIPFGFYAGPSVSQNQWI